MGMSQAELAIRIGIKQQSLSDIEGGRSKPRDTTLIALAKELNNDFGLEWLRDRMETEAKTAWEDRLTPVIALVRKHDFVLDLLIARLAAVSERFRAMLDPQAYADVVERAKVIARLSAPELSAEEIAQRERIKEAIQKGIEGAIMDLGTVDEFDIDGAIERLGDPYRVMEEWMQSEGLEYPRDYGVMFFDGWESLTPQQRADAIRDARKLLERTLKKKK